jgi:hypothetical protein
MANIAKLKELRNALVNFEENFDYEYVFCKTHRNSNKTAVTEITNSLLGEVLQHNTVPHDCGTVACLAGFTVALHKEAFIEHCTNRGDHHPLNAMGFAARILGLGRDEENFLFTPASKRYEIASYYDHNADRLPYPDYPYDDSFKHFSHCTKEQGYNEALRRLDYIIEYYSNKFNIA